MGASQASSPRRTHIAVMKTARGKFVKKSDCGNARCRFIACGAASALPHGSRSVEGHRSEITAGQWPRGHGLVPFSRAAIYPRMRLTVDRARTRLRARGGKRPRPAERWRRNRMANDARAGVVRIARGGARGFLAFAIVAGIALGIAAGGATAARAQTAPKYQFDPSWPKPLPNKWKMGGVTGLSVDKDDNVWVLRSTDRSDQYRNRSGDESSDRRLLRRALHR